MPNLTRMTVSQEIYKPWFSIQRSVRESKGSYDCYQYLGMVSLLNYKHLKCDDQILPKFCSFSRLDRIAHPRSPLHDLRSGTIYNIHHRYSGTNCFWRWFCSLPSLKEKYPLRHQDPSLILWNCDAIKPTTQCSILLSIKEKFYSKLILTKSAKYSYEAIFS